MMGKDQIKAIFLANGFKEKLQADGSTDLNPYVYDAAQAFADAINHGAGFIGVGAEGIKHVPRAEVLIAEPEEGDHDGRQLEWERAENKRLRAELGECKGEYDRAVNKVDALREDLANHDSASLLMNAWVTEHKSQMPWGKAIEMIAVVTKMPDAEKQRLLCLDDQYDQLHQRLTAAEKRNEELSGLLTAGVGLLEAICPDDADWFADVRAALKPTESGASE